MLNKEITHQLNLDDAVLITLRNYNAHNFKPEISYCNFIGLFINIRICFYLWSSTGWNRHDLLELLSQFNTSTILRTTYLKLAVYFSNGKYCTYYSIMFIHNADLRDKNNIKTNTISIISSYVFHFKMSSSLDIFKMFLIRVKI